MSSIVYRTVGSIVIFFALIFIAFAQGVVAPSVVNFSRNLRLGDTGEDVLELQKFLNKNERTKVAADGAGSPGQETTYFGPRTVAAVVKFQELYAAEVLAPAGLSRGSGFFGPLTRAKIQETGTGTISAAEIVPVPVSTPPAQPVFPAPPQNSLNQSQISSALPDPQTLLAESTDFFLAFPSQYSATRGTMITLAGAGFSRSPTNVVVFEKGSDPFYEVSNLSSPDGATLSFVVPIELPLGKYELAVRNDQKMSNKVLFVAISPFAPEPAITSVSPARALYGSEVIIHGSGFSKDGNDIYTSYGTIKNVPSPDGTTLTFRVEPFKDVEGIAQARQDKWKGATMPVWVYVVNGNGVSGKDTPGNFTVEF